MRLTFLLATLALLLGACFGDDDDGGASSPTATATATATPTASATPTPTATAAPTETATPSATAVPEGPTIAPDGRTANPAINALIEALLSADAATLEERSGGVEGRTYTLETGPQTVPAAEWAARLAASERSLYAVTKAHPQQSPPADIDITLAVSEDGGPVRGWRFSFLGSRLVDLALDIDSVRSAVGSVQGNYDSFLVLPPEEDLPKPPPGYPLSVRTGEPGPDALIALLQADDAAGLLAAVEYTPTPCGPGQDEPSCGGADAGTDVDALYLAECRATPKMREVALIERLLGEVVDLETTLHAVAVVPQGMQPAADHVLILVTETAPFEWDSWGAYERSGHIVGLQGPCGRSTRSLYPPLEVIAAPPMPDEQPDPARRTGVPIIDKVLDALAAHDAGALEALVDYDQVGCIVEPQGIGQPPFCEEGEGTLIDALLLAQCEGYYVRPAEALTTFEQLSAATFALFAANDLGSAEEASGLGRGHVQAVLVPLDAATDANGAVALTFTDEGITSIWYGCGPTAPEAMLAPGRAPSFLLAPPSS